jgi:guanine deaminase
MVEDTMNDDARWLSLAVELAIANVGEGGGPFGAVLVEDGRPLATGQNRVTRDNDPTAHAEVLAIRRACAARGGFALPDATLYASCEPCPLCLSAALWARVERVVYAADRDDAARGGFDDRTFYELFTTDRASWPTPVLARSIPGATRPFDTWLGAAERVSY